MLPTYYRRNFAVAVTALSLVTLAPVLVQAQAQPDSPDRQTPAEPSPARKAIGAQARTVIEAQLEAFAKDDAQRAYSYAAPVLQAQFESAENFMEMVRQTYAPVYRPSAVQFLDPQTSRDHVMQPVSISDQDGKAWIAVYSLVRIPDTGWRIVGCRLFEQKGDRGQRAFLGGARPLT